VISQWENQITNSAKTLVQIALPRSWMVGFSSVPNASIGQRRICGTFEQHPVSINLVYLTRTSRHQHVCCLNATFLCCDLFFPSSSLLEREPSVPSSSPVMQIKTCPWWWQLATGQTSTKWEISDCTMFAYWRVPSGRLTVCY
jgi:hypothetical protein